MYMQINFKKLLIIFFFLNLPTETIAEEIFLSLKKTRLMLDMVQALSHQSIKIIVGGYIGHN